MSRKIYYSIIAVVLAAIVITLGVFGMQTTANQKKLHVELIVKSIQEDFEFWKIVTRGAEAAAKEFDVNLTVTGTASEEDTEGQTLLVEKAIQKKPDVIVLAPVDQDALLPYAKEVKENDIELVLIDSGLSEQIEDCFVATNSFVAAQKLGEEMGKALPNGGEVAILSHQMTTTTANERIDGFKDRIRKFPNIDVIDAPYDIGDSSELSKQTTIQLIREKPDLKGIFATNQISAEGVSAALYEESRRDIKFYAFDSSTSQNQALEDGIVDGFVVQMPFNIGYMGVRAAVELASGTLQQKNIDTGYAYATINNMRKEEIQKLIYPFIQ